MSQFLFDPRELANSSPPKVTPPDGSAAVETPVSTGQVRLRVPQRNQVEMHCNSLDQMLEADHPARIVWSAVSTMDLSSWLSEIKAVEGEVGRDATDPRLLVALWVYATLRAVGSARRLAELCEKHLAFQWLCGGVSVNHRLLSEFRSQGGERWDALLTQIVATLMAEDLVTMDCVAQDGMRVRASAGKSSFRRRAKLEECLQSARQQVETLKQLGEENPSELSQRERGARERAAQERQQRIEDAQKQCAELQKHREEQARKSGRPVREARASTTDPEARVMQFSDGGYRPGYNVQFSTDTQTGIIAGVFVTNEGSDAEQLVPMLGQLQTRYGRTPPATLVDGGFATKDSIEGAAEKNCTVYAPLKNHEKQQSQGIDPHARKKGDSQAVAAWRLRMGTEAAKTMYRLRCQTAEWVNAQCRNRGLWQFPVRGQAKCRIVAVLYAIVNNLMCAVTLREKTIMRNG